MQDIVYVHEPPAGFEPALPPPEGGALSPELWGLRVYPRLPAAYLGALDRLKPLFMQAKWLAKSALAINKGIL